MVLLPMYPLGKNRQVAATAMIIRIRSPDVSDKTVGPDVRLFFKGDTVTKVVIVEQKTYLW